MFTAYTFQDWEATAENEKRVLIERIISRYKQSDDFKRAQMATRYFNAENDAVNGKVMLKPQVFTTDDGGSTLAQDGIIGNRVVSNFLFRFVTQQNQYLLGNGVTLSDGEEKKKLGLGFDKQLEQMGERALLHGVCWAYWNNDHMEVIPAVNGDGAGFVALLDERTGAPMLGVQFWQLTSKRPLHVRLFEADGVTEYVKGKDDKQLVEAAPKRAYKVTRIVDGAGEEVIATENYGGALPIVPFFANGERRSEFTDAIKSKIDLYDRITSDFGDNLDRANDVYWVLNNFGGTMKEAQRMIAQINEIRAICNVSDGMGNASTAEPYAFEVPYAARQTALELLRKELYSDYMALNMDELTGGSLTNVAIETAMTNLNLKCDRYEWQAFQFVQSLLQLAGVTTEEITFKRQSLSNKSEIVQDIAAMREDIDQETALKLNPYIMQDEIKQIIMNTAAQQLSGLPTVQELERYTEE